MSKARRKLRNLIFRLGWSEGNFHLSSCYSRTTVGRISGALENSSNFFFSEFIFQAHYSFLHISLMFTFSNMLLFQIL